MSANAATMQRQLMAQPGSALAQTPADCRWADPAGQLGPVLRCSPTSFTSVISSAGSFGRGPPQRSASRSTPSAFEGVTSNDLLSAPAVAPFCASSPIGALSMSSRSTKLPARPLFPKADRSPPPPSQERSQRLMDADEVVIHEVKRHRVLMVLKLFEKALVSRVSDFKRIQLPQVRMLPYSNWPATSEGRALTVPRSSCYTLIN